MRKKGLLLAAFFLSESKPHRMVALFSIVIICLMTTGIMTAGETAKWTILHEVALDPLQQGLAADVGAGGLGEAEGGVEFVKAAHRLDLRMVLGHPLPVEEAGRAVVAGPGGNRTGHGGTVYHLAGGVQSPTCSVLA